MRTIYTKLGEASFNQIWRALHAREAVLLKAIQSNDEESDEAIVANNDIIQLRALRETLRQQALEAGFRPDAFEVSEEIVDLSKL